MLTCRPPIGRGSCLQDKIYLWHSGTDTDNSAKCLSDVDQFDSRMNMYVNLPPQNSTSSSQLESWDLKPDEMHSAYSELCQFSPA